MNLTNRVSSVLTPSFRIEHTDAPVVRDTLLSNGLTPTTGRDWLIQWSGPGLRDTAYQEMNEFQRVNHFPGSTELTRKDRLWMNFLDMAETFGNEAFDFVPQTLCVARTSSRVSGGLQQEEWIMDCQTARFFPWAWHFCAERCSGSTFERGLCCVAVCSQSTFDPRAQV